MPRKDSAVILDADLTLDRRGEQIAQDAQHRSDRAHDHQDGIVAGLHLNGDDVVAGRQERVDQCEHHARQHAAKDAADGTLQRFVGTDDGGQLVLAEGPACKVSGRVTAPGEAEDQQDKVDGIIAILRKG